LEALPEGWVAPKNKDIIMRTASKSVLLAGMILGSSLAAPAIPVTFRVNMGYQIQIGAFTPGGTVEARGSFQSPNTWAGGFVLTPSGGDPTIYEGTYNVTNAAPGSTLLYKILMNGAWEANANRPFVLASEAQTLPVVYYNNTWGGLPLPVAFQVNLQVQNEMGRFDPAVDIVEAHGSFDGWGSGLVLTNSPANTNVYSGTAEIPNPPGSVVAYKFVINRVYRDPPVTPTQLWEGAVGPGGGEGDRNVTLVEGGQTLPVVYFNNLTNNPGAGIPVTFQVNMAVRIASGNFNPATGTVEVRGMLNASTTWDTGAALTNSPADTNVYVGTFRVSTVSPGATVAYKFYDGTYEGGNNRSFTLGSPSQTLPLRYFNDTDNLGSLQISYDILSDGMTLTWTGAPGVRLQSRTGMTAAWEDVAGALGVSSWYETRSGGEVYYRIVAP
jgi:hypothetical protein